MEKKYPKLRKNMNENSKLLYNELIKNKIISEIKQESDTNLTQTEIDLI